MDKRIQKKFGIDILQNIRKLTPPPMLIMLTNKVFNRYQQEARCESGLFPR